MKEQDDCMITEEGNGYVQSTETSTVPRRKRGKQERNEALSSVGHAPTTFIVENGRLSNRERA